MRIVFSIGGSVFAPSSVDRVYVESVASMLADLSGRHKVAVVVGGGRPAREAIAEARRKGASWAECDYLGILATRRNARVLVKALGVKAAGVVPRTVRDAVRLFGGKIVVMGGTEPGHSTDAVAALVAEWVGADVFVNASNVDAVYDRDPRMYSDAKPFSVVGVDELMELLAGGGFNAGEYPLLDPTSLKVIRRSGIRTVVLDGRDVDNMRAAAEGEPFRGTTIVSQHLSHTPTK